MKLRYYVGHGQFLGQRGRRRFVLLCPACRHGQRSVVGYRLWCWHDHKQAWVKTRHVGVDADLLPLLRDLWAQGFETRFSCAGGGSEQWQRGYVSFTDADGCRTALPVVRRWVPWAAVEHGAVRW